MLKLTLQSWLVQSERRVHLRCPEGLLVSQDEYLSVLQETSRELQLPLDFETVHVEWEDAEISQMRIRAKLQTKERFGILTGLDYIGRVAFVEQKTYLDPLELPELAKPDWRPALLIGGGIVGVGLAVIILGVLGGLANDGLFSLICCGLGIAPLGLILGLIVYSGARKAPQQQQQAAIKKWIEDVVKLAQRAEVSAELNNTAQALDEAVKLAIDRLFTQRGAELEADERRRKTATDIQNEVKLRREEFR